jgi:hypothetical protein
VFTQAGQLRATASPIQRRYRRRVSKKPELSASLLVLEWFASMPDTVYFVGAGLSKALQLSEPVPLMADFIRVASYYAEKDTERVTLVQLVGLELLARFRWPSPKARALAETITPRKLNLKAAQEFLHELRRRPSESIEELLANDVPSVDAALEAIYSPVVRFRYAISRIFSQIGWQVRLDLLEEFVHRQTAAGGKHTFVSFNYDLFLDRAISLSCPVWHWHCGYGFEIPYFVTADPDDHGVDASEVPATHNCSSDIRILKPHGSLHWLLPVANPNAAMPFENGPTTVRVDSDALPEYVQTVLDWPRVRYPSDGLPTNVGPGIIAPLRKKDARLDIFVTSRAEEFEAVRLADEVFVLGWSLPMTDDDQRCLIGYAVQLRSQPFRRVVVVNLNQPPEYFERIRSVFGVEQSRIEVWNDGFQDYLA